LAFVFRVSIGRNQVLGDQNITDPARETTLKAMFQSLGYMLPNF
jgi:hypothetical protein